MPSTPPPTSTFLRRSHLRARGALLLWALALALLATALRLAATLGWLPPSFVLGPWSLVIPLFPALAAAFTLAVWIVRARRLSPLALARDIDRDWTLASRLEASAELAADPSALAAAQRADAARHLAARRAPGSVNWFSAAAVVALAAAFLLLELSLLGHRHLVAATAQATDDPAKLAQNEPPALLAWRTPESEIKATAIEEVPLAALATSHAGLRQPTLEIAVNGEHRLSLPLSPEIVATLARPGEHPLELSLFLDETGAQEFDIVSYHLRAEQISSAASPRTVASPLQFVQIRPAREDVERLRGGGSAMEASALLTALKAAQLQLLKQNFLLAHTPLDRAHAEWRDENARVAADQQTLATKTGELRELAIAEALPALVVDNLAQALPLMETAAARITAAENAAAAEPQGRALALITATEKIIRKVIMEGGGGASSPRTASVRDPFKDAQQFKLPPRADTPAGQLEQLSQQQSAAASPSPSAQNAADAQAELAQKLAELAQSRRLDPSAQNKTEQAARDAASASAQHQAGDAEAARAPATAAAEALRAATAAQEAAGRATAEAELEKIRRDLNAAEREADPAARAAALAEAAERLRAEALAQQQTGSSAAARELAQAAAQVAAASRSPGTPSPGSASATPGQGEGQGPGSGPKSEPSSSASPAPSSTASASPSSSPGATPGQSPSSAQASASPSSSPGQSSSPGPSSSGSSSGSGSSTASASSAATRAQAALAPREQSLGRAARQLARGAGESPGTSGTSGPGGPEIAALSEIELGAQLAAELVSDLDDRELARRVLDEARRAQNGPAGNLVRIPENLRDDAHRLVLRLEAARHASRRDEQLRRYNPDDIAPAYRALVETYFERLSREARP
jgi:hypothetical protein